MQSKLASLTETVINIVVGYVTAVLAQIIIFPMFGLYASHKEHLLIGLCFTVVSILRLYCIRRLFNYLCGE